MIERGTAGKLQCLPYTHQYSDSSKQGFQCAFFMGLQRKQGEGDIQTCQQFDIRQIVDEFRLKINSYNYLKPGMEIHVSHVRRNQIPSYVFPKGYKRIRHTRMDSTCGPGSAEREKSSVKRSNDYDGSQVQYGPPLKKHCISPSLRQVSASPEIIDSRGADTVGTVQDQCSMSSTMISEAKTIAEGMHTAVTFDAGNGSSQTSPQPLPDDGVEKNVLSSRRRRLRFILPRQTSMEIKAPLVRSLC